MEARKLPNKNLDASDYVSRDEALSLLKIKVGTLYTYVSRGMLRSVPQPGTKAHLFLRADVERLIRRSQAHAGNIAQAESAMTWGAPIITTAITEITQDGPIYRGSSIQELIARNCSFEAVANLLWSGQIPDDQLRWRPPSSQLPLDRLYALFDEFSEDVDILKVFTSAVLALGCSRGGISELRQGSTLPDAQAIIFTLVGCMGFISAKKKYCEPKKGRSIAEFIAEALDIDASAEQIKLINLALVLCADFELSTSTFVARLAASTNCDLFDCIAAGICSHGGMITGRACTAIEEFFQTSRGQSADANFANLIRIGKSKLGFNHPLFTESDPRSTALLDAVRNLKALPDAAADALAFVDEATRRGAYPGIALGIVVAAMALDMPANSAMAMWTVSRIAGQTAHVVEQRMQGYQLRPRAKTGGGTLSRA